MNLHATLAAVWPRARRKHFFPELPRPRITDGLSQEAVEVRQRQIILNPSFCQQLAEHLPVKAVIEALLDHGIAHYTRCPWDVATHLRLYAAAKRELGRRDYAQRASDIFIDIVVNTHCVKDFDTALPQVYRHLQRLSGRPLDRLTVALYSLMWGMDLEASGPEPLLRRLARIPYLDRGRWEESIRRFCRLIQPVLDEERRHSEILPTALLGRHGLSSHAPNEVERGLRTFALQVDNPREFRTTIADFDGELAAQGHAEEQEGMGWGRGERIDTGLLYYMKLTEQYQLPVSAAPLHRSSSSDPHMHTPWELSKPLQDLDVWTSFGKLLPGLSQAWLYQNGLLYGRREGVPDCIIILDSSGSMANPRYLLSHAIVGAGCAADAYLRAGAEVAVYNFSDVPAGDKLVLGFSRERKPVYQALCRYFGGGTVFSFEELDELLRLVAHDRPDIFFITDMQIPDLHSLIAYLSELTGRITAVHIGETDSAAVFKKETAGWKNAQVFSVRRREDIPRIVLGQVKTCLGYGQSAKGEADTCRLTLR